MNLGLIIIGRAASSRLKNKMFLPLSKEKFIEQVFNRAQRSYSGPIIFATTTDKVDDQLVEMAKKKRLSITRGHASDILARYDKAATEHGLHGIITWDGDDLFVDKRCIEKTAELLDKGFDYVRPKNLPYGTFSYGIRADALKKVIKLKDDDDTQGWGRYFNQIPGFKIADYELPEYSLLSRLRLTLDYEEDYQLIKKVFEFWQKQDEGTLALDAIAQFAQKFPEDCNVNQNRIDEYQKRWQDNYSKINLKEK